MSIDKGIYEFMRNYYLLNTDCTIALGTISSLNVYAPVVSDLIQRTTLVNSLPFFSSVRAFLCFIVDHLECQDILTASLLLD